MDTTDPTPTPQPPVVLDRSYDYALLGHTVAADTQPRFVYSLTLMARREEARLRVTPEGARRRIWELIQHITRTAGDRAPLFVDDAMSQAEEKRIITLS